MLKIGLTGGIGSGKSAASNHFSCLGAPIIDADVAAREVVKIGSQGLKKIVERFGSQVLSEDSSLDRRRLRDMVFADNNARKDLEAILHPLIRTYMWQQLEGIDAPYAILDIPLLFETGQNKLMDRVVVVDCPTELQIKRICLRDNISESDAAAIIKAQISRDVRIEGADDVIDNSDTLQSLKDQVLKLHQTYLKFP